MSFYVNPYHLEAIKALTLSVAGFRHVTPKSCRAISFSIMERTKLAISETTVKRLYGFAISRFNPSFFTLNALSVYCGYESWQAFSEWQSTQKLPGAVHQTGLIAPNPSNDPLVQTLLSTSVPTIILKSDAPDFTIITYNKAYEVETHIKNKEIEGWVFWEAFDPQIAGGYGPTVLIEAMHEAIYTLHTVKLEPLHYNIISPLTKKVEVFWWDVKISPVSYDGVVKYLLLNVFNINNKILHQDAIEQAIMKELTLAEDLATTNVNLGIAVEQLAESNKKLTETKIELQEANSSLELRVFERAKKLFESEAKQRALIDRAPVAIAILKGPNHIVETANQRIIEYWGKTNKILNLPLAQAIPELEGQPFIEILNNVRETGIPYVNAELRAMLNINGVFQARYFDMIYQPVQHLAGITDSIYIVAVDITEHVLARERLKVSEATLRLAVTAANIGTWSFNPTNKVVTYNPIFAQILGWESNEVIPFDAAVDQVGEEYQEMVVQSIENAIDGSSEYDITYTHRRFNDNRLIWLRSTGKVTLDDSGTKIFTGVIREVAPGERL